jgi:hypothetical protein
MIYALHQEFLGGFAKRERMEFDVRRKYIFDNFLRKNFRIRMIGGNYA